MAINFQAGQLRDMVKFERRGAPVSDNAGNQVSQWETLVVRPASIRAVPATGSSPESIIQGRLTGTAYMTITVRYDPQTKQLNADDRATNIATGDIYNIRSALDIDGGRQWITLDCEKGVAT